MSIRPVNSVDLLPTQKLFWHALWRDQTTKFCWYVGGFGSGKTFVGALSAAYASVTVPKNRGVIGRFRLNDCMRTSAKTFFEVLQNVYGMREGQGYKFDRAERLVTFANGSEVYFIGFEDFGKFKSMELGWAWCDEVDEVAEEVFTIVQGRLRLKFPKGQEDKAWMRKMWITSNSEGQNWTYRRFVERKGEDGRPLKDPQRYFWTQASSLENRENLPESYVETLLSFDPDKYERYVLGGFNVFDGQVYKGFGPDNIFEAYPTPDGRPDPGWTEGYGFDYGSTNPTVLLKFYVDYDGNLYLDDERYLPDSPNIRVNAEKMMEMSGGDPIIAMADPSSVALKRGRATAGDSYQLMTVGDTYLELGITLLPANNDVMAGIEEVKSRLAFDQGRRNPFTGRAGSSRLFVRSRCKEAIREFRAYRWAKQSAAAQAQGLNAPEAPQKKDDHAMDALRYFVMSQPAAPSRPEYDRGGRIEDMRDFELRRFRAQDGLEKGENMLQSS